MFKLFRCQICGDPYLGDEAPSKCPFCGAKHELIIEAENYIDKFKQENNFTEVELANFKKALALEIGNASFYDAASKKSSDEFHKSLFKALKKVESEHASIFVKHLGTTKPELSKIEASEDGHENLMESHRREEAAIKAYTKFRDEATTPRAIEVFSALVEIEGDHLILED
ncbi:ferritin [Candidatus Woesearchaeota archaeon]|nr:MAG: ferritin [Candidatus Woesearchaeota archaeon]